MLYQSLKLTNGIWILAELRIQPGNPNYTVELPAICNLLFFDCLLSFMGVERPIVAPKSRLLPVVIAPTLSNSLSFIKVTSLIRFSNNYTVPFNRYILYYIFPLAFLSGIIVATESLRAIIKNNVY